MTRNKKPNYVKRISNNLLISLTYTKNDENQTECLVSFHNLLLGKVVVNPKEDTNGDGASGWFNSVFGSSLTETERLTNGGTDTDQSTKIFLGYIQLFGYVVCNYKYILNHSVSIGSGTIGSGNDQENFGDDDVQIDQNHQVREIQLGIMKQIWSNKDYVSQYNNDHIEEDLKNEGWDEDLEVPQVLDTAPFIAQSFTDRMIIGDKIGGINDLVAPQHKINNSSTRTSNSKESTIDKYRRYLLQDLVLGFNSLPEPKGQSAISGDGGELLRELADSILPFYTTSQSLLFSDIALQKGESKCYRIKFPNLEGLPPSYNTRLTGVTGDQGLLSIRYALAVGVLEMCNQILETKTAYFPYENDQKYVEDNGNFLLPDYFKRTTIDQDWNVKIVDKDETKVKEDRSEDHAIDKQSFLQDLTKLIESDLYNMPKTSTTERRRSFHNNGVRNDGLIAQIKKSIKTQYQIRVNNQQLCTLGITKQYYHIGDDINFIIDTTPVLDGVSTNLIVGALVYLEAHEKFHCKKGKNATEKDYVHSYKVSPVLKMNSFASSMMLLKNNNNYDGLTSIIHGHLNIPQYLTPQFQSSRLIDLEYYLVFKFNLNEFEKAETTPEVNGSGNVNGHTEAEISEPLISPTDSTSTRTSIQTGQDQPFTTFRKYHIDNNNGGEFHFRLPITIL